MADLPGAPEEAAREAHVSAELAARIRNGDRRAESEMIERYGRGLLYLLRRRARDSELALDLRQDTFRIAIEKLRVKAPEEPERLGAYLRGIAINLWLAHGRKTARRATTAASNAVELAADDSPGPEEEVSRAQARQAVRALLGELRVPRDREILIRLYLDEEDKESICDALQIDATHFNRVLFRAKQRFRALLSGAEGEAKLRLVK